jgi:hypothetical protein
MILTKICGILQRVGAERIYKYRSYYRYVRNVMQTTGSLVARIKVRNSTEIPSIFILCPYSRNIQEFFVDLVKSLGIIYLET